MPTTRALLLLALLAAALAAPAAAVAQGGAPVIADPRVAERSPREVVFTATVDPRGIDTEVRLEYGTSAALGGRSTAIALTGSEPIPVTVTLRGQPDSTYYWRFTATNAVGTIATEIASVETPAVARPRVLPPVAISFAVQRLTGSGTALGRVLGVTRPRGLPSGTRVSVRCRARCSGGTAFSITPASKPGTLVRFPRAVTVSRRSVVEVRATRKGSLGRVRRYVFRASGDLLIPLRVFNRCLSQAKPPRPSACRAPGA